ncbi:MAG: S16 family serine protease, partial [Desulfovibrio fairfieldensis]|nr:S16 family serine protease [Desulfovibrio fairfieldensis]
DPSFVSKYDIHVHVPAGATPKDGPSAGVTLTTALISALSNRRVRADLCMTGEITLQGRVLPVGGIKEKILAGVARGLKHVIIPQQNMKDLEDVPRELLKRITVHPVHHYDELPPLVFETQGKRGGGEKHGLTEKTSPAPRKKSPTRPAVAATERRGRAERPAEA